MTTSKQSKLSQTVDAESARRNDLVFDPREGATQSAVLAGEYLTTESADSLIGPTEPTDSLSGTTSDPSPNSDDSSATTLTVSDTSANGADAGGSSNGLIDTAEGGETLLGDGSARVSGSSAIQNNSAGGVGLDLASIDRAGGGLQNGQSTDGLGGGDSSGETFTTSSATTSEPTTTTLSTTTTLATADTLTATASAANSATVEYARMSLAAYEAWSFYSQYAVDTGSWMRVGIEISNDATGFQATIYSNGPEYVISYRGTDEGVDWWTNIAMGFGGLGPQIFDAIDTVENLLAQGVSIGDISFTGHSLGGGLAAVVAVLYDREATVFDPAPYGLIIDNVLQEEPGIFTPYFDPNGQSSSDSSAAREIAVARAQNRIELHYLEGEILHNFFPSIYYPVQNITPYVIANSSDASSTNLHSMVLLTLAIEHDSRIKTSKAEKSIYYLADAIVPFMKNLFEKEFSGPLNGEKTNNPKDPDLLLRSFLEHESFYDNYFDSLIKLADGGAGNDEPFVEIVTQYALKIARDRVNGDNLTDTRMILGDDPKYAFIDFKQITSPEPTDPIPLAVHWLADTSARLGSPALASQLMADFSAMIVQTLGDSPLEINLTQAWETEERTGGLLLVGGIGSDRVVGTTGTDLIMGGAGDDYLYGSEMDDVLFGGVVNGYLHEPMPLDQDGIDTADYFGLSQGIIIEFDPVAPPWPGQRILVTKLQDTSFDELYSIERLVATPHRDVIKIDSLDDMDLQRFEWIDLMTMASAPPTTPPPDSGGGEPVVTSAAAQPGDGGGSGGAETGIGPRDEVDASSLDEDQHLLVNLTDPNNQVIALRDDPETKLTFKNANVVRTGAGDDWVNGGGNYDGKSTEIFTGAGNDVIIDLLPGTIVYTGEGADLLKLGDVVLLADLKNDDGIFFLGRPVTGGVRTAGSDSPYAYNGLLRMGLNTDGELLIEDPTGRQTFVADANVGPETAAKLRTAGLYVIEVEIAIKMLLDPDKPKGWFSNFWKVVLGDVTKSLTRLTVYEGVDPLVFDLDGDGLELTARVSGAPRFDMDGDGFAEPSGWVLSGDGFLALDANSNGQIDDISELFGSPTQAGFDELATYDVNGDGVIDAADAVWASLRIWEDLDRDAVTDAGELKTLAEHGIASISLTTQDPAAAWIAGNQIAAEGSFTRSDGSSGTVADVRFRIDNFDTTYLGDTTVSPEAALQPNVKGRGTLTDLHVAMTQDPALLTTVQTTMPTLTAFDLPTLRAAFTPILKDWAAPDTTTRPTVPILISVDAAGNRTDVLDFGIPLEAGGWALASGDPVTEADGTTAIADPTYADIVAFFERTGTLEVLEGVHLGFLERHLGEHIPFELATPGDTAPIGKLSGLLDLLLERLDVMTARLAVQGPLGDVYFQGIEYDVAADKFRPTTERQLIPVFEAIFANAPPTGVLDYLAQWKTLLDPVLGDFERGGSHLVNSFSFLFANIVAAYESTASIQPLIDIVSAADALGVPEERLISGSGTVEGTGAYDIFYMDAGDEVARGKPGHDAYVFGRNFGQDVIEDIEPYGTDRKDDIIRFADIASTEVGARREGIDLIITVTATGDEVRVIDQFEGKVPGLSGAGDFSDDTGVTEVIFADGVVWGRLEIARQVSHPLPGDEDYIGTPAIDFLDGGAGNDFLSGGDDGDVYSFGTGYGRDTIHEKVKLILIPTPDMIELGAGLTPDSIEFYRNGPSNDLEIRLAAPSDVLTIKGQFNASYTGPLAIQWFDRIEGIVFDNGISTNWREIMEKMVADAKTDGDDTIHGFTYDDTLDGGAGNDFLSGGNESDTYIYGLGYGHDTVHEDQDNILSSDNDKILFTDGITQADVKFSRDGASRDLQITLVANSAEGLTISGQFDFFHTGVFGIDNFDQVERVEFADGTALDSLEIRTLLIEQAKTDDHDEIYGFVFDERLDGGLGNDTLVGDAGSDTYVFQRGYGSDTINDYRANILYDNVDRVEFGPNIAPADLKLSRSGKDLIIELTDSPGDRLTIQKQFGADNLGSRWQEVEQFHFEDGTVWYRTDIQKAVLQGTPEDDTLIGFFSADTLDGGAGNDRLEGGDDGDTYIYDAGYDHDTIRDVETSIFFNAPDIVDFGSGVDPNAVAVSRAGNDLILTISPTDSLRVERQFSADNLGNNPNQVEEFRFDETTVWTDAQLRTMLLQGTPGDDTLVGFFSADTLDGGAGNDRLEGGNVGDTYVFDVGYGEDVIYDLQSSIFNQTPDIVKFGPGITTTNVVMERVDGNLVVTAAGNTSDKLTVIKAFSRYYEVEEFHFDDNTVWDLRKVREVVLASTAEDDNLVGFNAPDTLDGGPGNDILRGLNGDDTYIFGVGYGQDWLYDEGTEVFASNTDKIFFKTGVAPEDLVFSRSNNDLIIQVAGTDDQLTIHREFGDNDYWIESFEFESGAPAITRFQVQGMLLNPTAGDDALYGYSDLNDSLSGGSGDDIIYGYGGADTLDGGTGNDYLDGGNGVDTYLLDPGFGQDVIHDRRTNIGSSADKVVFGAGIAPDDLTPSRSGNDLIFHVKDTTDQLTIRNRFYTEDYIVEQYHFDDGTVWSDDDVQRLILETLSTPGDDTIIGFSGADTLDGGAGNDYLDAKNGADTYIFGRGYGRDTILDRHTKLGDPPTDKVVFNADIAPLDLSLSRVNDDLLVQVEGTSDHLTILRWFQFYYAVEQFHFADGTIWTVSDVNAMLPAATAGDDVLTGTRFNDLIQGLGGNDTLDGLPGDDVLKGGAGDDTYKFGFARHSDPFGLGYGSDSIVDAGGLADTVVLGDGIIPGDIVLSRVAGDINDLRIGLSWTTDELLIDDQFLDASKIEEVQFSDGTIWTAAYIRQVLLTGTDGNDTLLGTDEADAIAGGAGDDLLTGYGGDDVLDGGLGIDTVDYGARVDGQVIDLAAGSAAGTADNDTLIAVENVIGGAGGDRITGDAADNVLDGRAGDDTLAGGAGADTAVFAGGIADHFIRFEGDAILVRDLAPLVDGDDGADTLTGVEALRFADRTLAADTAEVAHSVHIFPDGAVGEGALVVPNDTYAQDQLTYGLVSAPTMGQVTLNPDGSYSYLPNAGFTGKDSFVFDVTDPGGRTTVGQVDIDVRPAAYNSSIVTANDLQRQDTTNYSNYWKSRPAIAGLEGGGYVAGWAQTGIDQQYIGVLAQIFDLHGNQVGGDIQLNTTEPEDQGLVQLAGLSGGGFVAVWTSRFQDGGKDGVFGRIFDAEGTAVTGEFQVNTYTTNEQQTNGGGVTALKGGGFVVTWRSWHDGSGWGAVARQYDADGTPVTGQFRANSYTTGYQHVSKIAALEDGGYVIVWHSKGQDGSEYGVYGQRYDADGVKVGGEFRLNTLTANSQGAPFITGLPDGGFVAVWKDLGGQASGGESWDIMARHYEADGLPRSAEFLVNTGDTVGDQHSAGIAALGDGGYVVIWTSKVELSIRGQRFDADDNPLGSHFIIAESFGFDESWNPEVTALEDGGFAVTWQASVAAGGQTNVFTKIYPGNGYYRHDGTGGSDVIIGGDADEALNGLAGADILQGKGGDDTLDGGDGDDDLRGGDGNDVLTAGQGDDVVDGGRGRDEAVFAGVAADYLIQFAGNNDATVLDLDPVADGDEGSNTLTNVEALVFADQTIDVPSAVTAGSRTALLPVDTPLSGTLLATDPNFGPGALSYELLAGASNGVATVNADGSYSYTPAAGYVGTDSFTFQASDPAGSSDIGQVTVALRPEAYNTAVTTANDLQRQDTTNYSNYWKSTSAIAGLEGGGYVAAWAQTGIDQQYIGVLAQIFDAHGNQVGGDIRINSTGAQDQGMVQLAGLPGGGFVAVWTSWLQDGSNHGVYGRIFDAEGFGLTGDFRINAYTAGNQETEWGGVTTLKGGGFVVTWRSWLQDGSDWGAYARQFDADGTPATGEFRVNTYTNSHQFVPQTAALEDGGYVIVWHSRVQDGSEYGVYGQRYDADGATVGGEFRLNTVTADSQGVPFVTGLPDGGFVAVWKDFSGHLWGGESRDIMARRYDANGVPVSTEFLVNTGDTAGDQHSFGVATLGDGGYVVIWTSVADLTIRGQRFDASDNPVGSHFIVESFGFNEAWNPEVTVLENGGFAVTWVASVAAGGQTNVFTKAYPGDSYYQLDGSADSDLIVGTAADETLTGLAGNDSLKGNDGNDMLDGGAGDDLLEGGAGADVLDGGVGTDTASYAGSGAGVSVDLGTGTGSGGDATGDTLTAIEHLTGSSYDDVLVGDGADNVLFGWLGADLLDGGAGSDTVKYSGSAAGVSIDLAAGTASGGSAAGDTLIAIEHLIGSSYDDVLVGDAGSNSLQGLTGADLLDGGAGGDTVTYADSQQAVSVDLAAGTASGGSAAGDTLIGIEHLTGSKHDDVLVGDGADNVLFGWLGADLLDGGAGSDTVKYSGSAAGVSVDLSAGTASGGSAAGDTLIAIEHLIGSSYDDVLVGDADNNHLQGLTGADLLDGGAGDDTVTYADSQQAVSVDLALGTASGGSAAGDTLVAIEHLTGSKYDDVLVGNGADNVLFGWLGADLLDGGAGADTVKYQGSTAGVSVDLSAGTASGGSAAGDTLTAIENLSGSAFGDALTGDAGTNELYGEDGDDLLEGGAGADVLAGGAGSDTFIFKTGDGADSVQDFAAGLGSGDVLDVSGLGYLDLASVLADTAQNGADAVIQTLGGDSITLVGVEKTTLHDDDFIFA